MAVNIGIDVWPKSPIERVSNQRRSIAALVRKLRRLEILRIIVESTGGYERDLVQQLARAGLPVVVVNPRRVRSFGESIGWLAKTDGIDARLLALFGEKVEPEIRPILQGRERLLADLIARRRQLMKLLVSEKNRLGSASHALRSTFQPIVRAIEKQIEKLDARIDHMISEDEDQAELRQLVQTTPGVGPGVSRTLLIDLPELGHLGRREITSLVGLAPFARDSGTFRGYRRIRGGRASVRTALYLAAMTATRFNPTMKVVYERMIADGKAPKLALVAIARKLLVALNAIARDRVAWQS
jgi:transposase